MNLNDFEPTRRLTTRAEARQAFDASLSETRRLLRIFDRDGEFFGLDRRVCGDLLGRLLREQRDARVVMIMQRIGFIEQKCPLLSDLLRSFAPRLLILGGGDLLREHHRGLVIADDRVVLRRPHFDQPVTFVDYDEQAVAAAGPLFEALHRDAGPALPGRLTGF